MRLIAFIVQCGTVLPENILGAIHMTKPRVAIRGYRGQKGSERAVAVKDAGNVNDLVVLAFGRKPGYRTLNRGRPVPLSSERKTTRHGILATYVTLSREGALALHEALDEFLFGEGSG